MPEVIEYRTVMYSVKENGEVDRHLFPWNANSQVGMEKLLGMVKRGFTFEDPRKAQVSSKPEVLEKAVEVPVRPEKGGGGEEPVEINLLSCPECGKECKSAFGLQSHMRIHKDN